MKRFLDRVVVVTGSSRGIGRAIALEFAKEGARVVVNYKESKDSADQVIREIKEIGVDSLLVKADVSNEADAKSLMDQTVKKFGRIDILINNAGIVFDKSYLEHTLADWENIFRTDLFGPFLCSKYASTYMLKMKYGRIINISSTNGTYSFTPDSIDYDSAKAGLIQLTKNLAKALAPHILVNSVAPGWIDTDMNKNLPKKFLKNEINKTYLKRYGTPWEIARPVLFLASDDAKFITGKVLEVDGDVH